MAKLYTSTLGGKPKHGKKARPKRAKRAPVDPLAAPTEAALAVKYGPAEQQIEAERRISGQQMANTGHWFDQYRQAVATANQQTAQGYQRAQGAVYGQANLARQQDTAQAGELDRSAQASAALRGATVGANPAAQAAAARQTSNNSFGGLLGAQGAVQNTYGQAQYANAVGTKASELQKEQGRRRALEAKAGDLAKEKGYARQTTRQELSDAAWKTQLEEATFGLKRQDTLADNARLAAGQKQTAKNQQQIAKDKRAARKLSERNAAAGRQVTREGQHLSHEDRVAARRIAAQKKAAGKKGKVRYHKGYGNTNVSLPVAVTKRSDWEGLLALGKDDKIPKKAHPLLVNALKEYDKGHGKVSKKTALKIYRTFGFRVPYSKPKKKKGPGIPIPGLLGH